MSYADLAALKSYLRIPEGDTEDDNELQSALDTATAEITHLCSRTFEVAGEAGVTRYFQPFYDQRNRCWVVPIDDTFDSAGLTVKTWDATDTDWTISVDGFWLRPINAIAGGKPVTEIVLPSGAYTGGSGFTGWAADENETYVAVNAIWGWPAVPAPIVEATKIQASRIAKRRDAPFGVTASPDGSENTRLGSTVDVDVQVALRGWIKYWAAR